MKTGGGGERGKFAPILSVFFALSFILGQVAFFVFQPLRRKGSSRDREKLNLLLPFARLTPKGWEGEKMKGSRASGWLGLGLRLEEGLLCIMEKLGPSTIWNGSHLFLPPTRLWN